MHVRGRRELHYQLHKLYSSQEGGKIKEDDWAVHVTSTVGEMHMYYKTEGKRPVARLRLEEGIKFSIRLLLERDRHFGFHEWWQFLDCPGKY